MWSAVAQAQLNEACASGSLPGTVQRARNTRFEFDWGYSGCLNKAAESPDASPSLASLKTKQIQTQVDD
jgi:hypothetical protein